MTPVHTILLVEGRKPASDYLASIFDAKARFEIVTACTRKESLLQIQEKIPEVIVLDCASIRFSARRFCDTLHENGCDIPVLILLPQGEELDSCQNVWACMNYPFTDKKLVNRIERLLSVPDDDLLEIGELTLNLERQSISRGNTEIHLTPKQAKLLEIFMRHPGEILSRAYLMKQVWNTDYMGDTRTLDVHIHWVRKAIEEDYKSPVYLRTIRRVGYCFDVPDRETS
ncbi:MAG TPA: response regulator transcription factor [Chloroflexi bacterium]|nr:response regulator transcription factor [Chloroflexota bacterium]